MLYYKDHVNRRIRQAVNAAEAYTAVADAEREHENGFVRRPYAVPKRVLPPIGHPAKAVYEPCIGELWAVGLKQYFDAFFDAQPPAERAANNNGLTYEEQIQVDNHYDPIRR